jgi:hypothetical protein
MGSSNEIGSNAKLGNENESQVLHTSTESRARSFFTILRCLEVGGLRALLCTMYNTLQFGAGAYGGCITSLQRGREITEPPPSSSFRHPHTLISIITCNSTSILYNDAERHCTKSVLQGVE